MDKQRSFFDGEMEAHLDQFKGARGSDPSTSKRSASQIKQKLGRLHFSALELIRQYPGKTAQELRALAGWDVHKRLRELERLGKVREGEARTCQSTGRTALTWLLSE